MALSINDVLSKEKIKQLLGEDLQYSTLVSLYGGLGRDKYDLISAHGTSFIDVICDDELPGYDVPERVKNRSNIFSIQESVWNILSQKIRIGLIAIDEVPVENVRSAILLMDEVFISNDTIIAVCEKYSNHFLLKPTDKGLVLRMARYRDVRLVGKKETTAESDPKDSKSKSTKSLVAYIYKSKPELVRALQTSVSYKDVLKIHQYWSNLHLKNSQFLSWLLVLARANDSVDFAAYREALETVFVEKILLFLDCGTKTIGQIVDNLCVDKTGFIEKKTVCRLIEAYPRRLRVACNTRDLRVGDWLVRAADEEFGSRRQQKRTLKRADASSSVTSSDNDSIICDEFNLPERIECRILPLLGIGCTLKGIIDNYRIINKLAHVRSLVEKYGCFLYYLIEKARTRKPESYVDAYVKHLEQIVTENFVVEAGQTWKEFCEYVYESTPHGLLNDEFLRQTSVVETPITRDAEERKEAEIDHDRETEISPADELTGPDSSCQDDQKSTADLESPRVIHLLTRHPRFVDIFDVFAALPEASISILQRNSMSFFEWLISLCKRLMPYDSPSFENQLHTIVQAEVARLHSKQHCQMTIQHVHSLICEDKPMLLSPNFLSWCLEQSGSSFTVHQSWIYLRNTVTRNSVDDSSNKPPSSSQLSQKSYAETFVKSLVVCKQLTAIIDVIRKVPLEYVGQVMRAGMCWYEHVENVLPSRQSRQDLAMFLTQEIERYIGGTVQYLDTLRTTISQGVPDFITNNILDEILRQNKNKFALSLRSGGDCSVALVRQVQGDNVNCADTQEEIFLREVLFYFPPSGSCSITTILDLANKEDSFLHKKPNKLSMRFLECFFMAFPMLFYLRGDVVVLTCMALDLKLKWVDALNPTSTTGGDEVARLSPRKRSKPRRASKSKRRKTLPEKEPDDVIEIDDSEPEKKSDNSEKADSPKLRVDETVTDDESTKNAIESLLPDLVVDITTSLLHKSGGRSSADPLMKELLTTVLGAEEYQQVLSSPKHWVMFKRKVTKILEMNPKFTTLADTIEDGVIHEVRIVNEIDHKSKEGEYLVKLLKCFQVQDRVSQTGTYVFIYYCVSVCYTNSAEPVSVGLTRKYTIKSPSSEAKVKREAQVGEVTSTSVSPVPTQVYSSLPSTEEEDNHVTSDNTTDDVIKLPTPYVISDQDESDGKEKSSLPSSTAVVPHESPPKHKSPQNGGIAENITTYCPANTSETQCTVRSPDQIINPVRNTLSSTTSVIGSNEKSATSKSKPAFPSYSSMSSASSAYKYIRTSTQKPTDKVQADRERVLSDFLREYLTLNGGSCATELLIADAYRRFRNERFARSQLAFEAFIFDIIALSRDYLALSGTGCDLGMSKLSFRHATLSSTPDDPNEFLWNLIPNMWPSCAAFLSSKPGTRARISDVCQDIIDSYQAEFETYPKAELAFAIRCIVLVSMIRNLKVFCFAVDEPAVYLRGHRQTTIASADKQNSSRDVSTTHVVRELQAIVQNKDVRDAVLLMETIVKESRPGSQAILRNLWQQAAPSSLSKVFGTGISFTLAMRKYSFLFPASDSGVISVNEDAIDRIRSAVENQGNKKS